MNVIILNAGYGWRFGGKIPKCLLKLNGETIIDRQLRLLRSRGLNNISVAVSGRDAKIDKQKRMLIEKHLEGKKIKIIKVPCHHVNPKKLWTLFYCKSLFSNTMILLGDAVFSAEVLDEILLQNFEDLMFVGDTQEKRKLKRPEIYMILTNSEGAAILKGFPNPFRELNVDREMQWVDGAYWHLYWAFSPPKKFFTPTGYIQDVDYPKDLSKARRALHEET